MSKKIQKDNHKIWLIVGISVAILIVLILFLYPYFTGTPVGKADAPAVTKSTIDPNLRVLAPVSTFSRAEVNNRGIYSDKTFSDGERDYVMYNTRPNSLTRDTISSLPPAYAGVIGMFGDMICECTTDNCPELGDCMVNSIISFYSQLLWTAGSPEGADIFINLVGKLDPDAARGLSKQMHTSTYTSTRLTFNPNMVISDTGKIFYVGRSGRGASTITTIQSIGPGLSVQDLSSSVAAQSADTLSGAFTAGDSLTGMDVGEMDVEILDASCTPPETGAGKQVLSSYYFPNEFVALKTTPNYNSNIAGTACCTPMDQCAYNMYFGGTTASGEGVPITLVPSCADSLTTHTKTVSGTATEFLCFAGHWFESDLVEPLSENCGDGTDYDVSVAMELGKSVEGIFCDMMKPMTLIVPGALDGICTLNSALYGSPQFLATLINKIATLVTGDDLPPSGFGTSDCRDLSCSLPYDGVKRVAGPEGQECEFFLETSCGDGFNNNDNYIEGTSDNKASLGGMMEYISGALWNLTGDPLAAKLIYPSNGSLYPIGHVAYRENLKDCNDLGCMGKPGPSGSICCTTSTGSLGMDFGDSLCQLNNFGTVCDNNLHMCIESTTASKADACHDGEDNDGNGLTDCEDPNCLGKAETGYSTCCSSPTENGTSTHCEVGKACSPAGLCVEVGNGPAADTDGDGVYDLNEPEGCVPDWDCDDDGIWDGDDDCPTNADPGCGVGAAGGYILGDVDNSGDIDITDILVIVDHIGGDPLLLGDALVAANVDCSYGADGITPTVDITDILIIVDYIGGTPIPACS